jgi:hypothetical protein
MPLGRPFSSCYHHEFHHNTEGVLDESKHGGVPGYTVACKSVVDPTGDGAKDLLQEATIMATVGVHDYLVSLIGVVTSGVPLLIIMSLCEHGSLKSQLEKRALGEGKLAAPPGALPPKIDADIALEIARGMLHLVEHHLVHRDLAARNVLLDSELKAKVADFGLSRAFADGEEYYKSSSGMMALRWTAPEALATLKFSTATDVWAFGIVLLEIYTNGEIPLKELTNAEVMAKVQSGYKSPKPSQCPRNMYKVMISCWDLNATNRPNFPALIATLSEDMFESSAGFIGLSGSGSGAEGNSAGVGAGAGAEDSVLDSASGAAYIVRRQSAVVGQRANAGLYASNGMASHASALPAGGAAVAAEVVTSSGYVVKGSAGTSAGAGLYAANRDAFTNPAAAAGGYVAKGTAGEQAGRRANAKLYAANQPAPSATNAGTYVELGSNPATEGEEQYLAIGNSNTEETTFGFGDGSITLV